MEVLALELLVYAVLAACAAAGAYLSGAAAFGWPGIRVRSVTMARRVNACAALVLLGFPLLALTARLQQSAWAWPVVGAYAAAVAWVGTSGAREERRSRPAPAQDAGR